MFEPISDRMAFSQKIIAQITDKIITGELEPGDRIPPERELAEIFGVSRSVIRDAIKVLSGRGVLDVKHGIGIFVAKSRDETRQLVFTGEKIRDLFEIRQTLETQASAWAAERANTEYVERLKKTVDEALKDTSDLKLLAQKDAQFHVAIAESSQNLLLVKIMWMLLDALGESRQKALEISGRPIDSLQEHAAIIEAIELKDKEQARLLMHRHLTSVERSITSADSQDIRK
ncbi:FadR/GntR family transcriptional regulator [Alicyclobacillus sp. SO9]|uniref:FadR/GntR family transcriptional regulator n=1 Tax=Alicyclobacillus sp. SO9 TaxID=2665646 RepID=UPI0018E7F588|nr:FadR/GntR family transcriptional regulator [Alicyclobacillus sp. SO9]QQE80488.1 FadR family transcriptional regulator [Alicyclobacillus sp. SO9]